MVRTMVVTPALRQSQEGAPGHSGEQVGHAVGAAAFPVGSSKHHGDGVPALVSIGGYQFNPTGAHVHAQDLTLPVGIDSRRHHRHADVDDAAAHVAHFMAALDTKVFFADEAHFRADAELRGKWVLKGEPALVDSTSPRRGEKAGYYSAVCLETGEVEWMELEGNSNAVTSAAFLLQLRERHSRPLQVIWDNAPAHRGEAVRDFLATPGLGLRLVNLPGYSPDFNADEAVWGWAREEATGNLCLGTKALVQESVNNFLGGLASRRDEVKRRCRTVLQSRAAGLLRDSQPNSGHPENAHPTLALV